MYDLENHYSGFNNIACVDEVGRGCLAGDVVSCAIVMPKGLTIDGVKDSKKLSEKKREELYEIILANALGWGIGRVDANQIDKINIKEATRLAMRYAVENLIDRDGNRLVPDLVLIDAETIDSDIRQESIIKGDEKSFGIACASIIAKVTRDRLCQEWSEEYPAYGIEKHKGYGTKIHRQALINLGPSPIHRLSFLKKILK